MILAYVGLGTAIGAVIRMFATLQLNKALRNRQFPWATFLINMFACFLIGILTKNVQNILIKTLLISGIMGGLSTFSTFANEIITLFQDTTTKKLAVQYLIASLVIGFILVEIGIYL